MTQSLVCADLSVYGKKVNSLNLPPGVLHFGCGHCYRLTYKNCRESGTKYSNLKGQIKQMDPFLGAKMLHEMAIPGDLNAMRIAFEEMENDS